MSEISDIFEIIAALSNMETTADEMRTLGNNARDVNGCSLHRTKSGVALEIFSDSVDLEAAARRAELEGYVSTLMPDNAEEAYGLLMLANHIATNCDLEADCELRRRFTRCLISAITFYEGAVPPEAKTRLKCYGQPVQRWPEIVSEFEEAKLRFRRIPSAPTSIGN